MKSKPFIFSVVSLAVVMLVASCADGGFFCGRGAQRRQERRQHRQAARQMACANNMAVAQYSQPVASYGVASCQSCAMSAPQFRSQPSIEYSYATPQQPQPIAYHEPSITYAPMNADAATTWQQLPAMVSRGSGGQCRFVDGQWRCGG